MIEFTFYLLLGLLVAMAIGMIIITIKTGFPYSLLNVPPPPEPYKPLDKLSDNVLQYSRQSEIRCRSLTTKRSNLMSNRIWIEIDKNAIDAETQVALTNNMLRKLGIESGGFELMRESNVAHKLIYVTDSSGSFDECPDWGRWFNLDFLSK